VRAESRLRNARRLVALWARELAPVVMPTQSGRAARGWPCRERKNGGPLEKEGPHVRKLLEWNPQGKGLRRDDPARQSWQQVLFEFPDSTQADRPGIAGKLNLHVGDGVFVYEPLCAGVAAEL